MSLRRQPSQGRWRIPRSNPNIMMASSMGISLRRPCETQPTETSDFIRSMMSKPRRKAQTSTACKMLRCGCARRLGRRVGQMAALGKSTEHSMSRRRERVFGRHAQRSTRYRGSSRFSAGQRNSLHSATENRNSPGSARYHEERSFQAQTYNHISARRYR